MVPSMWIAVKTCALLLVLMFLAKAIRVRRKARRLQREGFSMPPHSPVFGHLLVIAQTLSSMPKDAHPHYLPNQLRRRYPELAPIFYLDGWPFMTLCLVVSSPETMSQITTEHVLPKFPAIRDFLYPLANGFDLVSMDGPEWKYWRDIFNPGFSAKHLMTMVPSIVDESTKFVKRLDQVASTCRVIRMKQFTDDLAMDVIGKIVLDSELDCQRKTNPMVQALRRQMGWMTFGSEGNPLQQYHPLRWLVHPFNTWQMDRYITPEVNARFEAQKVSSDTKEYRKSDNKTVVDLALAAYLDAQKSSDPSQEISLAFKKMVVNMMKLFLFSGHDTTSSTICYILYMMSVHSDALNLLQNEHQEVVGGEPAATADRLAADPYIINKLPYTTAFIKETMRLFPAASSTRSGEPSFTIFETKTGKRYPADPDMLIWLNSHACHHDPALWPRVGEFLPERWLANQDDELYPARGAWRPFEQGPRSCIGKELSMIELKIVTCLVARSFRIEAIYNEIDALKAAHNGNISNKSTVPSVSGERAYQVGKGEPNGNLPCRIIKLSKSQFLL